MPFPLLGMPSPFSQPSYHQPKKFPISLPKISAFASLRAFPPQLYSGSYFTFVPRAGFHYYTYTPWQFIGDLSAPHHWTVNYSSLPGNMELLNKCMWDEYRNYFLLLFVLLPILQGPAQMSPLLFWIPYPGRINHTFCVPVALYTHFYYSTYQIASYFIIGLPRATTTPESTIHTEPGNTEVVLVLAH